MGVRLIVRGATYTAPSQGSGSSTGGGPNTGGGSTGGNNTAAITFTQNQNMQLSAAGAYVANPEQFFWASDAVNIVSGANRVTGKGMVFQVNGKGSAGNNTAMLAFYSEQNGGGSVVEAINDLTATIGETAGGNGKNYFGWGTVDIAIPEGARSLRVSLAKTGNAVNIPNEYCNGEGWAFVR